MTRSLPWWRLLGALACLVAVPACAAPDWRAQRGEFRLALEAAERGQLTDAQRRAFAAHPLGEWLEVIALRKSIDTLAATQAQAVLDRVGSRPAGSWFREAWLGEAAKRADWASFRKAWTGSDDPELRCDWLQARADAGAPDAAWNADAQALWLTGKSLPDQCDPVFALLAQRGKLDADLRWQRIDLAVAEGQSGLVRFVAKGLPAADAAQAQAYADYLDRPAANVAALPRTPRSRAVATVALARLGKREPARAEQLLAQVAPALGLDEAQRGKVLYEIALWTVASYGAESAKRLAAVPESAFDDRLHEWRVREALSRGDRGAALAALRKLPEKLAADARFQYFQARLLELEGRTKDARALYADAADDASFHGWLAADRLGQSYALCPLEVSSDKALRSRLAADAGLARALEWFALDRPTYAAREWSAAIKPLDDTARRVAVALAQDAGWYDRAVFAMNVPPDDSRHYRLRFPLHHDADIRRFGAANRLDPAWVAAQTRAESAFMPRAGS